nr:hypothetical protein [Tanacetum cinerariifolium]
MLTFANLPSFLWVEAIATACFTQNCSIIHKHFDKTPYELMNKRKPNIKFFRVFGWDIGVFVGYSKEYAVFRFYNKRTRKINESVNVNFDEISKMYSKQFSLEPGLSNLNETGKSSNPSVSQVSETSKKDMEDLFHNFYDEYFDSSMIMKSSTTNVETSINEEVFHEDHPLHKIIGDPKSSVRTRVGYSQQEGIDYDETFAPVTQIKAIHLLLAYAAHKDFTVFQMDVKQCFSMEFLRRKFPTPMVEKAKLKLDLAGKPVDHTDYRSMIGSLMYVTSSRPDIMFATCDKLVCWSSKKQNCLSISTAESEYVAVSSCCAQVLWVRTQLTDYGFFYDKVSIYCDSKSAIAISCNLVQHTRTKHNDVRTRIDPPRSLPSHLGKLGLGDGV